MPKKKMSLAQKVNVLRASVMGANDGIISVAGIVIGVAAATSNPYSILISGLSGSLAGTISMCMGEYVSVSTQKDSQKMALISERQRLKGQYQQEFNYVQKQYEKQDIDPKLAHQATKELMDKDALSTVVQERYGFNPKEFTSPYAAAIASIYLFPNRVDFADGGRDDGSGKHPDLCHHGCGSDCPADYRLLCGRIEQGQPGQVDAPERHGGPFDDVCDLPDWAAVCPLKEMSVHG